MLGNLNLNKSQYPLQPSIPNAISPQLPNIPMMENIVQQNPLALTYTSHSMPTTSSAIFIMTP